MAVADVYDALRNKRHYKDAMSHEETIRIIRNGSGTHFQPELVEALLRIQDDFEKISIELKDDNGHRRETIGNPDSH
jgi:putative two-component system response regulator